MYTIKGIMLHKKAKKSRFLGGKVGESGMLAQLRRNTHRYAPPTCPNASLICLSTLAT